MLNIFSDKSLIYYSLSFSKRDNVNIEYSSTGKVLINDIEASFLLRDFKSKPLGCKFLIFLILFSILLISNCKGLFFHF